MNNIAIKEINLIKPEVEFIDTIHTPVHHFLVNVTNGTLIQCTDN